MDVDVDGVVGVVARRVEADLSSTVGLLTHDLLLDRIRGLCRRHTRDPWIR